MTLLRHSAPLSKIPQYRQSVGRRIVVSADAVAFASVRVMGIGFATGQAAGVAAAFLAAGRGTPVSEIQAELRRQGACI